MRLKINLLYSSLLLLLAACGGVANSTLATLTPDPVVIGRQVFQRVCAACHGLNAEGYANELNAPALDSSEHAWEHPDQEIHNWVMNGKLGFGRQMPALGDQVTDDELHALIDYLHTLWDPQQLEMQQNITSRWPATPEPGR